MEPPALLTRPHWAGPGRPGLLACFFSPRCAGKPVLSYSLGCCGFLQMHASGPVGPGQAWRLCGVGAWVEGGGSLTLGVGENCGPNIPQRVDTGQTPFAGLALLPSECAPGQACLWLSGPLGQLQASMICFLCRTSPSSLCVKRPSHLPRLRTESDPSPRAFLPLGVLSLPMSGCTILGIGTSRLKGASRVLYFLGREAEV